MRKNPLILLLLSLLWLTGCAAAVADPTGTAAPPQLTVFAAASLSEPFSALAAEFEAAHPNTAVQLNFAGSQSLRLQIEQGAAVDVFASANAEHMQTLVHAGLMAPSTIFARNQLAVIVPASNPARITTLADLARPGLKLVLAGPSVPAGRYARIVLANLNQSHGPDYSAAVLANLVSEEENVKSVVAKVQLAEADAGLVYISDVTPALSADLRVIEIPDDANVLAAYPLSVSAAALSPALAQKFVDFVLSSRGQTLLAQHSFHPTHITEVGQQP